MDRRWGIVLSGAGLVAGWLARSPYAPLPEPVIRWAYAPGEVRTDVEVRRGDPASAECLDQRTAALVLLGVKRDVELETPATELGCRAELDLADAVETERQMEQEGRPQPFLADTPDQYREAAVTAVARKVVETCPELGLTFRRVDCSEYPCMAWFVGGPEAGSPMSCEAWTDGYGTVGATSSHNLIGPDGHRLQLQGIGPVEPSHLEPPPSSEGPGELAMVGGDPMRRIATREQNERDGVVDELGAREETEAEQHEDVLASLQRASVDGDEVAAQMVEALKRQWAAGDAAGQQ